MLFPQVKIRNLFFIFYFIDKEMKFELTSIILRNIVKNSFFLFWFMYKLRCDPFIGIFLNTSRMSSKCNLWYKICRNNNVMLYMMIKHILLDTDRYILGYSNVIYACYFTCLVAKLKYLWMHIRIFAKAFPSNYISCHDVLWIIRDLIFEINSEIIKESLFSSKYFKSNRILWISKSWFKQYVFKNHMYLFKQQSFMAQNFKVKLTASCYFCTML